MKTIKSYVASAKKPFAYHDVYLYDGCQLDLSQQPSTHVTCSSTLTLAFTFHSRPTSLTSIGRQLHMMMWTHLPAQASSILKRRITFASGPLETPGCLPLLQAMRQVLVVCCCMQVCPHSTAYTPSAVVIDNNLPI